MILVIPIFVIFDTQLHICFIQPLIIDDEINPSLI
jgi:hypothetical protein